MSLWNRTVVALETTSVVRGSGRAFLLTLDPFLLLVATSITIALLPLGISLRVHVTKSGSSVSRAGESRTAQLGISSSGG